MYEKYCKLRDNLGVSDSDVSRLTGVPRTTFSEWKSGKYEPKQNKLRAIADFFGVSLDYFTGDVEEIDDYMLKLKYLAQDLNELGKEMLLDYAHMLNTKYKKDNKSERVAG